MPLSARPTVADTGIMSGPLNYDPPRRYPAVVFDRWGRYDTVIVNDGQWFSMSLRGNDFSGNSLNSLQSASPIDQTGQYPQLCRGELCSCTIEWSMPLEIVAPAGRLTASLHASLHLGNPTPVGNLNAQTVTLTLQLPDDHRWTSTPADDMEGALLDVQRRLPEGTRILACITCAFSDYYPAGSSGVIGSMGCFRDAKDSYRAVTDKMTLIDIWGSLTGYVQETFRCNEYEQREPNTGYRG